MTKQYWRSNFSPNTWSIYAWLLCAGACGRDEVAAPPSDDRGETHESVGSSTTDATSFGKECTIAPDNVNTDELVRSVQGCEILHGHIVLGRYITDLTPLSSLRVLDGDIVGGGYNSRPLTLEGLENLESMGDLHFLRDNIQSLSGIPNLKKIRHLRLEGTPLRDLHGLENVETIESLRISQNENLTSIAALQSLKRVSSNVQLVRNPRLPREEVDALLARVTVGGTVARD